MRRKSRKNVGVIGLGIIGSRAAASLRSAGYRVFVWNRSPKPVPNFLGSPGEVAGVCEVIQIFVADAAALMQVLEGMRAQLTADHVILCNATVGPDATADAAKLVQATGARFLDAPFTGSKVAAERQQLVYYVGGDEATYLRVKPILEATSKAIVRVGEIGDAATIKVVTNLISAASIQVLSEAMAIVRRAGIPPEALAAALEHNAARSGVIELKLPKMMAGDYEPHFSLKHMLKDVKLGLELASHLKVDVPVTTATRTRMEHAVKDGHAEDDFSSVYRTYEGHVKPEALPDREQQQHTLPPAKGEPASVAATPASAEKPVPPAEAAPATGKPTPAPEIFPEKPAGLHREKAASGEGENEPTPAKRPPHIFARIFADEEEQTPAKPAASEIPAATVPVEEKPSSEAPAKVEGGPKG